MGLGTRIFIINEDDTLRRIPLTKYERLMKGDPGLCFREYAGQRVRYAFLILENKNRKPVDIIYDQYSVFNFDSEGRIDREKYEDEVKLSMQMVPPLLSDQIVNNVVDAQHRFAKRRLQDQYSWEPTPEIVTAIAKAIFGND